MAKLDPSNMAANWQRGVQSGAQKFRDGVSGVTVHPGQKAAAQQARMLQRLTDAVTSGRWGRHVAGYSLSGWITTTSGVGAQNYVNGAQKGLPKYTAFAQAISPKLAQLKAQIASMPATTSADTDARMLAAKHFMEGLKGIGKGGMGG